MPTDRNKLQLHDPDLHALVYKTILSRSREGFVWNARSARNCLRDPSLQGLTPSEIRNLSIEHVRQNGVQSLSQVVETRPEWNPPHVYYYKIIIPHELFYPHGLFVELRLEDDDDEFPAVRIVNAHPQLK